MSKKQKRYYTLHLMSEDNAKPFILTFNHIVAKIVIGFFALIILFLFISVFKFFPKAMKYDKLKAENDILIQDRIKVTKILSDYNQIRQMDQYIRSSLGNDLNLPRSDSSITDSLFDFPTESVAGGGQSTKISFLDNIPIYPPVDGYITQGFATNHIFSSENHYGVDVVSIEGEPIRASASGVVVFSNWTPDLGNTIIIYHSDGYFTIYGHNQRNYVEAHQYVNRGEVIGFLGNTGKSRGPHLHFEIWKEGTPVNPQDMIYSYKHSDISIKNVER